MEQIKVVDLSNVQTTQVDKMLNDVLSEGFSLISLSDIEVYQDHIAWGVAIFIKGGKNEDTK